MTITEKLISTLRYMFKPVMIFYWLGATLAFLLLFYFFLDASFQMQLMQSYDLFSNFDELMEEVKKSANRLAFILLVNFLLMIVIAKSIDSAKQISEANMDECGFNPVAHIGWKGIFKYSCAYNFILLILDGFVSILSFVLKRKFNYDLNVDVFWLNIHSGDLSHTVVTLLFEILFIIINVSCTLVFLETLGFFAMINPGRWLEKLKRLDVWKVIIIIMIANLITEMMYPFLVKLSVVPDILFGSYFLAWVFMTMFGIVWLGYFVDHGLSATTDG